MIRRTWPRTISLRSNVTVSIASLLLAALAFTGIAMAVDPLPLINQPLVPDAKAPGGAGFTLTVNGTGFVSGSIVHWNGSPRTTTFVNESRLTASILASDIAKTNTASVTVVNPTPGGGTSNTLFFEVTNPTSSVSLSQSMFATGSQPDSVKTADFNGDGRLDLALANYVDNTVSILLGNGDGTFQAHVDYATEGGPDSVVLGDFNGDGKVDLAVRNQNSNTLSVLLGNGDGTFRPAANFAVGIGTVSSRVAAGDFNGDGKLDLAATNWDDNTVSILLGNGDGTFQGQVVYALPSGPAALTVGDFNKDGKLDLAIVVQNGSPAVAILLGKGDGTFQAPVSYSVGSGPSWINAADFNGDGILDLVVPNSGSNTVSVLLGKGDGTFQPRVDYAVPNGATRSDVADLNGDGRPDLIVVPWNASDVVSILFGKGDGSFQAPVTYSTGSSSEQVVAGDFNGDGKLDLAVADNGTSSVSLLLQAPTVALSPPSLYFGIQLVGTGSTAQAATLTNTGYLTLNIASISITGANASDFGQNNNCASSLPPGGHCTLSVSFTPSHIGPRNASITITDNGSGSPQSVALSGTGVVSGPNATLSPTSLTFATQLVGTASSAQTVTLTNYGAMTLDITGITASGDFNESNTCGSSLGTGASCTIDTTFPPRQIGNRSGVLKITDNAPDSPQKVTLTGVGTVVELNPASLSFGKVPVGQRDNLFVTLTNTGTGTLSITGTTITGSDSDEFSLLANTCGSSVGAGQSCFFRVLFTPTEVGADSASLSISDNGGGSPQQVSLSGSGEKAQQYVCNCLGGRPCDPTCHIYGCGCHPKASSGELLEEDSSSRVLCDANWNDWLPELLPEFTERH